MLARRSLWVTSFFGLIGCSGVAWGNLEILGEISFDLKVPDEKPGKADVKPVERTRHVTQAAPVECIYQYPETKQVDAMLSNMMNQLTKMFVRVENYLLRSNGPGRREDGKDNKRFKVVKEKKSPFFDDIYFNMTEEYRRFANHTQQRVMRASDPCEHQSEIRDVWRALLDSSQVHYMHQQLIFKPHAAACDAREHQSEIRDVWRALLDSSQESVRRAALACVEKYLLVSRSSGEGLARRGRARSRVSQLLRREIARVRRDQLALLCDRFQLCYNDLI